MAHSLPVPVPVPAQLQLHSDGLQSVTAAAEGSTIGLQPGEPRGSLAALLHPRKSHGCALFPLHQQVHVPAGALTDRPALSPTWLGFSTLASHEIKVSASATSSLFPCTQQNALWTPKHGSVWGPSTPQASCPQPQQLPQRTWLCFAGWGATRATNPTVTLNKTLGKPGKGACG